MLDIGIDTEQGLFYEGRSPRGRAIWPNPFVTPSKIVFNSAGTLFAEKSSDPVTETWRFREDFFDPVSHIRRGRFYAAGNQQPLQWHVQPHPAIPSDTREFGSLGVQRMLYTYRSVSVWHQFLKGNNEEPLVLLGLDDRFTIWTIVGLEVISTGEELVTLKARRGIGVLPSLDVKAISASYFPEIQRRLEAFVDEVHRAGPISVIDRARDAASLILIAYFDSEERGAQDLSKCAERLIESKKFVAGNAAKMIALLHSRAKPSERKRHPGMRDIREEDAQLATKCLGTLLCEIGWADWKSL